jgi:hypothetical protein
VIPSGDLIQDGVDPARALLYSIYVEGQHGNYSQIEAFGQRAPEVRLGVTQRIQDRPGRLRRQRVVNVDPSVQQVWGNVHIRNCDEGVFEARVIQLGLNQEAELLAQQLGHTLLAMRDHVKNSLRSECDGGLSLRTGLPFYRSGPGRIDQSLSVHSI